MPMTDDHHQRLNAELARRFEAIAPYYGFLVRGVLHEQAEGDRLTIPQFRTMQTLRRLGMDGATNLDLARHISVSPPAMTAMIDGLVERALVTRGTDPENRRQVLIRLTELGDDRLADATAAIENRLAEGINQLTPEEVDHLDAGLRVLKRVFEYLHANEEV